MYTKNTTDLLNRLNSFITKYYLNQLIKGGIYSGSVLLIFFILFSIIEYFLNTGVGTRTFMFWTYILINLIIITKFIIIPLFNLLKIGKKLKHKDAAKIIGIHFSEIDDKITNILELSESKKNELIIASIDQKIKSISPISFNNAINLKKNIKHTKWILIPISILLLFFISGNDYILTKSSKRIIKHNTFFEPEAPFNYIILNENMNCIQFNDFMLMVQISGNEIPSSLSIIYKKNTYQLKAVGNNTFKYLFKDVNQDMKFRFVGGGYTSKSYTIKALMQPKVVDIKIKIKHPKYTNKETEIIKNNGDISISEGAIVSWQITLHNTNW